MNPELKYTGKDLDEDTGLYYFNARWYDASTGRFISEDPTRDGQNWYIYTSNNPMNRIDPTGLSEVFAEDINGQPIVAFEGRDLKSETVVEVNRTGEEGNFSDDLSVKIGNQKLVEEKVRSTANWDNPADDNDGSLAVGDYNLQLLDDGESGRYRDPMRITGNGILKEFNYLIHPDRFTNETKIKERILEMKKTTFSPPVSSGCIVTKGVISFNRIRSSLEGLGFGLKEDIKLRISE